MARPSSPLLNGIDRAAAPHATHATRADDGPTRARLAYIERKERRKETPPSVAIAAPVLGGPESARDVCFTAAAGEAALAPWALYNYIFRRFFRSHKMRNSESGYFRMQNACGFLGICTGLLVLAPSGFSRRRFNAHLGFRRGCPGVVAANAAPRKPSRRSRPSAAGAAPAPRLSASSNCACRRRTC